MAHKRGHAGKVSGMADIKDLIQDFIDKNALDRESGLEKVKSCWAAAAGDYAAGTQVYKYDGKKVFIYASNSVVMSELTYRKKEIMRKLNGKLGRESVKEIICRLQR